VVRNTESFTIVAMATGKVVREIAGHESIRQFMENHAAADGLELPRRVSPRLRRGGARRGAAPLPL